MIRLLVFLLVGVQCWGAFDAQSKWEVRTTGSDANGGGFFPNVTGVDYSQQDSPQITFTDIVIGASTDQGTSALNPFTTAMRGNVINITAGAGCTVQRVQIASVSGITASFDKSLGTTASVCTGALGGGLLTIQAAVTLAIDYNQIFIKSGTYTHTAEVSLSGKSITLNGYQTTRGDRTGTRPLVTTATDSTRLFRTAGNDSGQVYGWANMNFSNTASVRGVGIGAGSVSVHITDCMFDGFSTAFDHASLSSALGAWLVNVEIKHSTVRGIFANFNTAPSSFYAQYYDNLYVHDNAIGIFFNGYASAEIVNSVISANTAAGVEYSSGGFLNLYFKNTTLANNGTDGIKCTTGDTRYFAIVNSVFYGNTGYGINCVNGTSGGAFVPQTYANNAFGSNTAGSLNGNTLGGTGLNPITLTADPFTNAAAGDFSPNSTAGGGALLKGTGYGGSLTGQVPNVGAIQTGGGAAAVTLAYPSVQ